MREYVQRKTTPTRNKLDQRIEFKDNSHENTVRDKPVWVLFQLVTGKGMGLDGLDPITPIRNSLDQRIESGKEPTMHGPGTIYPVIADLALYAELWIQFAAFNPTAFYHASADDKEVEMLSSHLDDQEMKEIEQELYALSFLDVLEYPVDKPRTKSRSETMQRAESNLDDFWDELDKHVKTHCSEKILKYWSTHWPQKGDLKRTQDWVDTETDPSLGATPFSFGDEKAPATEGVSSASNRKNRKKKRKSGNVLDSPKTDAQLTHTLPRPQTPDIEKPPIKISKEAWRVVEGGLFHAPKSNDNISKIPWSDFLEVMKSLGFTAERQFGSVWRFEPGKKAMDAGFDRGINFHESHGVETKLTQVIARRIGRRLNRAYGLDLSRLIVEK